MVRCILADDQAVLRMAMRMRLELDATVTIVAEADSGTQALDLLLNEPADVAILDMRMPGLTGLEVAEQARRAGNTTPLILLTALEPDSIQSALAAGVAGLVSKDSPLDVLIDAIFAVTAGRQYVDPAWIPPAGGLTERGDL